MPEVATETTVDRRSPIVNFSPGISRPGMVHLLRICEPTSVSEKKSPIVSRKGKQVIGVISIIPLLSRNLIKMFHLFLV